MTINKNINLKLQFFFIEHPNIKAFITHGGLMGTLESIAYGVPMVGVPLFGDQYRNVKSYVQKNLSVMLPLNQITERSLTMAITTILNNSIYR